MELALVLAFLMAVLGFGLFAVYKSDPEGWKRTFKRLSTTSRASLESRSMQDWDRQFEGKALGALETKHKLAKTWHSRSAGGMFQFSNWQCSCGVGGRNESEMELTRNKADRRALRAANRHIRLARKQELQNPDGDFTF
jgi:hypothetical protein